MYSESKRHHAWLAAAMSAPLAHYCGGSWLQLAALALILSLLCRLLLINQACGWIHVLQSVWAVILLGSLSGEMSAYWPGEKAEWIVPAAILLLAAYGCTARPAVVGAVLCLILAGLYVPFLAAGVRCIRLELLRQLPQSMSLWAVVALLLPGAAARPVRPRVYIGIALFGTVLWGICCGVLPPAARGADAPLRILSRTVVLGSLTRLEVLVSAAMTLSWFCFAAWLIRFSTSGNDCFYSWITAAAACLYGWFLPAISDYLAALGSFLIWYALPFIFGEKNTKKSENSA